MLSLMQHRLFSGDYASKRLSPDLRTEDRKKEEQKSGHGTLPTADQPVIESGVRKTSDDGGAGRI